MLSTVWAGGGGLRAGALRSVGKSKTIMKSLNPEWEAVEVDAAKLEGVTELTLQVL